jgi:signal transduction histidine kinase
MKHPLRRRLMAVLTAFTLGVCALFGLLAMGYVYTVEDLFLERRLQAEASRQRAHHALHGQWLVPVGEGITLHTAAESLPADLREILAAEPRRREIPGEQGRHYHLQALQAPGSPPWLVAEVSSQLIVRPLRGTLLGWLLGGALAASALSLWLAHSLARRISAPLEQLAARLAPAAPGQLPQHLAGGLRDDEIGALARAFDALLDRTRAFIDREQAFTRDASHELRTPLAVLHLAIERLQAEPGLPATARQQLAPMLAATRLMEQTVHTLLLLAREGEGGVPLAGSAPTPVLPLVEAWVLAHAAWLDEAGMTMDVAGLSRQATLALPPAVLQLALANLLGNAVTHGLRGGCITLRLAVRGLELRNPSPPWQAAPGALPPRGEASSGFGLGLAIVQRLLQGHGSRLLLGHEDGVTWACIAHPDPAS